ncbi:MAG: DUF2513 domain-containing protein [Candidatus Didemnitutus sp.]|nr:DUF2513 domain-containing protein [Candidatus Didemnitutus sp.]
MDLVRGILKKLEDSSSVVGWVDLEFEGRSSEEVAYHVMLLHQAGYVDAQHITSRGGLDWRAQRLTWKGHEFLSAARNEGVWSRMKSKLAEKGLDVPFDLAKELLMNLTRQQLGM